MQGQGTGDQPTPAAAAQRTLQLLNLCRGDLTRLNRQQLNMAARDLGLSLSPNITKDQLCQEIRQRIVGSLPGAGTESEQSFTAGLWRGPKGGELQHLLKAYSRFRDVVLQHPFLAQYLLNLQIALPSELCPALLVEGTLNGYRVVVEASSCTSHLRKVHLYYPPDLEDLVYSGQLGSLSPGEMQTTLAQYVNYRRPEGYRTAVHRGDAMSNELLDPDQGLLFRLWYHPGFVPQHIYFCVDQIHPEEMDRLVKAVCKDVWPYAKAQLFSGAQSQLPEDTLRKQAFQRFPYPLKLAIILQRPFDPESIDAPTLTRLEHAINSITQVMQEFRAENPEVPFASNDVIQYLPYLAFKSISSNPDYQYLFAIPEVENMIQENEPLGDYRSIMNFLSFAHNQLV